MEFKDRLKKIMEIRGLNQSDLEKLTGFRQSTINEWLNGKYKAKQDKLDVLATKLNVSPAWLTGKTSRMERKHNEIEMAMAGDDAFAVLKEAITNTIIKMDVKHFSEFPPDAILKLQQIAGECLLLEIQTQIDSRNRQ